MGATLDGPSTLEDGIFAVDLDCGIWFKEEIGASGEHEVRRYTACLHHTSLKQGRVALHERPIDLCLPVGYDKAYTRGRRSHANQAAGGEQRDGGL
jgi:hypothetical protein